MSRALTGRADLFRALVRGDGSLQTATADMLGLEVAVVPWAQHQSMDSNSSRSESNPDDSQAAVSRLSFEADRGATSFLPVLTAFWRAESLTVLESQQPDDSEPDEDEAPPEESLPELLDNPKSRVEFVPLAHANTLVSWLRKELAELREGRQLDVPKTVEQIGQGRWLDRLPRCRHRSWGSELFLVRDFSQRLMPFDGDFEMVIPLLQKVFPNESVLEARIWEEVDEPLLADPLLSERLETIPPYGATVFALTDLGLLGDADGYGERESAIEFWSDWGNDLARRGHRAVALCPVPEEAATAELVSVWQIIPWSSGRTIHSAGDLASLTASRRAADRVLRLLSMAIRIEPGLLRAIRQLVPEARANPSVEALAWNDRRMSGRHPLGATMEPAVASSLLDELFKNEDEALLRDAFALILAWHAGLPEEIRFEEVLRLGESRQSALFDPELLTHAMAWFKRLKHEAVSQWTAEPGHESDYAWTLRLATRFPEAERQRSRIRSDLYHLTKVAARHSRVTELPDSVAPVDVTDPSLPVQHCRLGLIGGSLTASVQHEARNFSNQPESPLATISFRQRICIRPFARSTDSGFDIDRDFWDREVPRWASDWGIDEFGPWAEFRVAIPHRRHDRVRKRGTKTDGAKIRHLRRAQSLNRRELADRLPISLQTLKKAESGQWVDDSTVESIASGLGVQASVITEMSDSVTQRMRWVEEGTFLMGSPEDEPGRRDNEGPQHEVRITHGFWMFDTPCTQALWEAVMGGNPSRFQTPDRPVEQVSWEDCQKFFKKLRELVPGLDIDLPTEAEWEFACRAGANTAPFNGPFEILGANNAPGLDPVAWYGGNSGVDDDSDLSNGVNASGWPEKQDQFDKAATHPVGEKGPSPLGLYDMLGNVHEWCLDGQRPFEERSVKDPVGSEEASASRVIRGGSWFNDARDVRAAYRGSSPPDDRFSNIGFRCRVLSSGPSRAAAEQAVEGGSLERAVSGRSPKAEPGGDSEQASEVRPTGDSSDRVDSAAEPLHSEDFLDAAVKHFDRLPKPAWASDWGYDELGLWAELRLFDGRMRKGSTLPEVIQRLRLIPPGTFLMGSLRDDVEAFEDEHPQHEVMISQAFWMFDSPCTQGLWEAVNEVNSPSYLKGSERPVERVSWNDCQKFTRRLSARFLNLELDLPTEAEWEYACRAGSTDSRYGVIDEVAWWGSRNPDGTVAVREKNPNKWGLYDTLGNVWEWCRDASYRAYTNESVIDPLHNGDASADRVIRGGSWINDAREVRAAYRASYPPGDRDGYIGFRCRIREPKIQQVVEQAAAGGLPASREGRASVELRSRKAEPGGDSETTSVARAAWINLTNSDSDETPIPQAPAVRIVTDVEEVTLREIQKPNWASAIGRDRFGLWCEFEIASDAWKELGVAKFDDEDQPPEPLDDRANSISFSPRARAGVVTQRLRWIPPGQFTFGSSKSEPGRFEREFEPTQQIVESGFWMFDTPCTQELWTAVMGRNASTFKSPTRPVEKVSWDDCTVFLDRLGDQCRAKGFELELPGELEWEYACRAGTTEATYAGPMEILGQRNAPILDSIAWYGGNCGVDFDLPDGWATSDWPEKQHEFETGGTHRVATKQANPWGLFDTLGNVWEWCDDVWREPGSEASDSDGASAVRVIRGGSWHLNARGVRAACRDSLSPGYRSDCIGFRCRVRELKQGGSVRGVARAERRSRKAEPGEDSAATSEAPHAAKPSKSLPGGIVDRFRGKKSDD